MKKLLGKTWAKVAAFLLLCLLIPALLGSVAGLLCAYDDDWFDPNMTYTESSHAHRVAYHELSNLEYIINMAYFEEGSSWKPPEKSYQDYSCDLAFSYVLYNGEGKVLWDTRKENSALVIEGRTLDTWELAETDDKVPASADAYLNLPISRESFWYTTYSLFVWAVSMRGAYLPLSAIFLVLSAVLFVFLMMSAGRKEDIEEIVLGGLNRLPFDLYAAALITLGLLIGGALAEETGWDYYDVFSLAALCLLIITATVFVLALCMTIAARVKAGKWWRNTVIYRLIMLLRRLIKAIWRGVKALVLSLPITWKAVLAYVSFILLNLVLIIFGFLEAPFFLFLAAVLDVAVLVRIVFVTLQYKKLIRTGHEIAGGDMSSSVDTSKMWGELKQHGDDLNSISLGVSRAVDERMRSERFKTELITNVSHDLKTPLTSIVNYVDLLKKENIENERAREYIEVLDRQSEKLRKLTVDLVDASKASSGAVTVNRERLELGELIEQCSGEYGERLTKAGLELVCSVPDKETIIVADGRLLWRVLDNLMQNVIKYSLPGTRTYLTLERSGGRALLSIKNISREQLNIPADELLERFVRGDASRASEGSGLGLSIAKSLTELMGGTLELFLDGDLFKAVIGFGVS